MIFTKNFRLQKNTLVFLLCFSDFAIANEDTVSFSPMTIYTENESDTPNSINDLDHQQALHQTELPDLNGILRQNPSVTLNQGSAQMASNLSLRGAGGQGMLTLDGVPLFSDFVGVYSLQRYSIDELDRVTVSRSFDGSSTNSRTLGGAIHLKTRQLQKNDHFLHLEGGSYDSLRESAGAGFTTHIERVSSIRNSIYVSHRFTKKP